MTELVDIAIHRDTRAPRSARRAVEQFADTLDPSLVPDVKLLVSELITNSVKYGGEGPVRLEITHAEDKIRTEIVDQGVGFTPKERDREDLDRVGGWGLHLVEQLTSRWGTYEGSTHVWFEIELGDRRA